MIDLALHSAGETASPLEQFMQEVDIVLLSESTGLLTDKQRLSKIGLEDFLFKAGVGTAYVTSLVSNAIAANVSKFDDVEYAVEAKFIEGQHAKDILLIEVVVSYAGQIRKQAYSVQ